MRHAYLFLLLGLALPALAGDGLGLDPFATRDGLKTFTPCSPVENGPLSLTQVVDGALCANPQTREAWANARVQAAQLGVAEAAWLPTLSASAGSGRNRSNGVDNDQRTLGLTASWLLFDFGARSANIENARQLLEAANATRDATVQSVFLAAVQAFYQAQSAEASLAAAREAEKAAEQSFRVADAKYAVGSAAPADKLQAQTAYSQAQLTRITAEGALKTAQGTLAAVLGRDAHRPVVLAAPTPVPAADGFAKDVNALVDEARRRRPDLLAAQAQVKAAEAGVDAAKAAHLPSLSLGFTGSDTKTGGVENRSGTLGVTLSVPLFTGFSTTYKVQTAEAQREAKAAQAEKLRLQVAQDVWNAWQSLLTATQTVRTTADLIVSAEQSDKVARGRYAAGVGTLLEMLTAQSALASARQQRVTALYSWNIARTTLAQAMGVLDNNILTAATEGNTP
ncbi:TolC family type I secretion outer membrane protein [Denitratisoma sp. agr-D3]